MRKIFGLFAIVFVFAFMNINANAAYFTGEFFDEIASPSIYEAECFNVIKCFSDYVPEESKLVDAVLAKGTIFQTAGVINADGMLVGHLKSTYEMLGGGNCIHTVEIGDTVIYKADDYFFDKVVEINEEVNMNDMFGYCARGYHISLFETDGFYAEEGCIISDYKIDDYIAMTFIDVRCKMVQENSKYKGCNVFFVCDQENPKSISFYKSFITATDETAGDVTDSIQVFDSNYPENLENIATGTYYFSVMASDSCGNTAIQKFAIEVVDVTNPVVEDRSYITSYERRMTESQILSLVNAYDRNNIVDKDIIEENYFANQAIPGEYYAKVSVTDEYGNSGVGIITIIVEDEKKPVITLPKSIYIKASDTPQIEEIKSKISIIDGADGEITDYTPIDIDGYNDNPNKVGIYKFKIEVADKSLNKAEAEFTVYVTENDFPVISAGEYVLVLPQDEKLKKEDIIQMLNYISDVDLSNAELSSPYFDDDNPAGEYQLMVSLSNGTVLYHTIRVSGNANEANFDIPVEEVKESINYALIIGIVAAVAVISVLGIVIYRKRH